MRTHRAVVAFSLTLGLATAQAASQASSDIGTDPSSLVELKDDLSRAHLFGRIVEAAKKNAIAANGGTTASPKGKTHKSLAQPFGHILKDKDGIAITPSPPAGMAGPMEVKMLVQSFSFPSDALFDRTKEGERPRTDSIFGIDVSHYTPSIPLQALRTLPENKITFVYMKATQGTTHYDSKFAYFWSNLDGLGIHRGAYHFLDADKDPRAQADTFLKFLRANGGLKKTDMPPVLDLEWDIHGEESIDRWAGQDPNTIVDKALAWLDFVQRETGRTPLLYTAKPWWNERGITDEKLFSALEKGKYKIWIADYSESARAVEVPKATKAPWILWQFSEKARLPSGDDNGVDATIFKGPESNFYNDLGLEKFR